MHRSTLLLHRSVVVRVAEKFCAFYGSGVHFSAVLFSVVGQCCAF